MCVCRQRLSRARRKLATQNPLTGPVARPHWRTDESFLLSALHTKTKRQLHVINLELFELLSWLLGPILAQCFNLPRQMSSQTGGPSRRPNGVRSGAKGKINWARLSPTGQPSETSAGTTRQDARPLAKQVASKVVTAS